MHIFFIVFYFKHACRYIFVIVMDARNEETLLVI